MQRPENKLNIDVGVGDSGISSSGSSSEILAASRASKEQRASVDYSDISETSMRRIRIAFLSAHFHDHSIGRMLIEITHMIQRYRRDMISGVEFELFVFFLDKSLPDDFQAPSYSAAKLRSITNSNSTDAGWQSMNDAVSSMKHDIITDFFLRTLGNYFIRLPHRIEVRLVNLCLGCTAAHMLLSIVSRQT